MRCRFLEQGDLHNCLRCDKEGKLRWYKWCAVHCSTCFSMTGTVQVTGTLNTLGLRWPLLVITVVQHYVCCVVHAAAWLILLHCLSLAVTATSGCDELSQAAVLLLSAAHHGWAAARSRAGASRSRWTSPGASPSCTPTASCTWYVHPHMLRNQGSGAVHLGALSVWAAPLHCIDALCLLLVGLCLRASIVPSLPLANASHPVQANALLAASCP